VSVVAYDHVVLPVARPAARGEQPDLLEQIRGIPAGGTTNLSGGWLMGREFVAEHRREGGVNRVLLLTDGLANEGITDFEALLGLCAHAKKEGVTTTTIGFGADYDENLLRGMADAGGGNLHYIEKPDQAGAVFADELTDLLNVAAQNVSVTVTPSADVELVAVHHDYPRSIDGRSLRLELGDLYAGEPRAVLAEFLLRTNAVPGDDAAAAPVEVGTLVVVGHVIEANGAVSRREISLPITVTAEGAETHPEVRKEMLLLEAARARREAIAAQERGDFAAGAQVMSNMAASFLASPYYDESLAEEAHDLGEMAAQYESGDVSPEDAKYLFQRAHNQGRGRRDKSALFRRDRG
jgi:Ca-activated chloride channel family protein